MGWMDMLKAARNEIVQDPQAGLKWKDQPTTSYYSTGNRDLHLRLVKMTV